MSVIALSAWTDRTFNPWTGCSLGRETSGGMGLDRAVPVSGARQSVLQVDRATTIRRTAAAAWAAVPRWNDAALDAGRATRVLCATLGDVFDDHPALDPVLRRDLWSLIRATQGLDWMLLTRMPWNIGRFLPPDWDAAAYGHVWLGVTVQTQAEADLALPRLVAVPGGRRFLNVEPLLEGIALRRVRGLGAGAPIDLVICGVPGDAHGRPSGDRMHALRADCAERAIPFRSFAIDA